ncbi:hypothetical protein SAMN05421739_104378 [Pontibacter chinhatensis]|uniref:Uncharacterized protein n=1 Tax=Pontibacter chinhatensis TaxID=1436961 RepID=A0A1I2VYR5_9BACT|nr:hypothetical protein SAMN05421739_104378 [Pontibacter chinhatensis]
MGLGTKYKPTAPFGSGYKAKINLPHLKLITGTLQWHVMIYQHNGYAPSEPALAESSKHSNTTFENAPRSFTSNCII